MTEIKTNEKNKENVGKLSLAILSGNLQMPIEAVRVIGNDALFTVKPEGISVLQVDTAHVAMVEMTLLCSSCEEYHANEFTFAIDLDKLSTLLKLSEKDEMVHLDFDGNKEYCLSVSFGNLKRKLSLLDIEVFPQPKIPLIETTADVILPAAHLRRGIIASEQLDTDYIKLIIDKDSVEFFAEDSTDVVSIKLKEGEDYDASDLNVISKSSAMYTNEFIQGCLKAASKKDSKIKIALANDNPVTIDYIFDDDKLKLRYLVAPRIEAE